jgi:hypothetical protein
MNRGPGIARAAGLLVLSLLLTPLMKAQAQDVYTYSIGQEGSELVTVIVAYSGPGGALSIPSMIDGFPVAIIGADAFYGVSSLTSVTLPDTVLTIETNAFEWCVNLASVNLGNSVSNIEDNAFASTSLTSLTLPASVTSIGADTFGIGSLASVKLDNGLISIGEYAFSEATNLTSISIPNSVTSIGLAAFEGCNLMNVTIGDSVTNIANDAFQGNPNLTSITIPASVTSIGAYAFEGCTSLTAVYFEGNAPNVDPNAFPDEPATMYYLAGTTGWTSTLDGRPTAVWTRSQPVQISIANAGVQANQFGFTITGTSNTVVVVEGSASLVNPTWTPLQTTTLTSGSAYFADPQWKSYTTRFYRLSAQ